MKILQNGYIYRVSIKKGRSRGWEHGKSQGEQKSLIPFCQFRNSQRVIN